MIKRGFKDCYSVGRERCHISHLLTENNLQTYLPKENLSQQIRLKTEDHEVYSMISSLIVTNWIISESFDKLIHGWNISYVNSHDADDEDGGNDDGNKMKIKYSY